MKKLFLLVGLVVSLLRHLASLNFPLNTRMC